MNKFLLISLLSGCTGFGWEDCPTATVTPIAQRPEVQEEWVAVVATNIALWNDALVEMGCPEPFRIGENGHPIELIRGDRWEEGPKYNGMTYSDRIHVCESTTGGVPDARFLVVAHELGHAIGLEHANLDLGPSVMASGAKAIWDARDARAAACEMGCGPCEDF